MSVLAASIATLLMCVEGARLHPFEAFVESRDRQYRAGSAEYSERRAVYESRAAKAEVHNSQQDRLWTAGVNDFWDWTASETASLLGWRDGARPSRSSSGAHLRQARPVSLLRGASGNTTAANASLGLPAGKSWLHLESAIAYRNQGVCGSCWALAAVGVLEASSEIHGKRRTFSAQEMVSCVPNPQHCGGTGGCQGSTVELALDWVLEHGLAAEHEIPYAQANGRCTTGHHQAANAASAFGLTGWQTLPQNKYLPLLEAVVHHGPVAVSVSANDWLFYISGVFNGCPLDTVVNHAVVLYGYGQEEGRPGYGPNKYWTIQNSWGRAWGEEGFIRLLRHDDDEKRCGIDRKPEQGTGCFGGPPQVTVCGMCGVLYDSVVAFFD